MPKQFQCLLFAAALLFCACFANAQVPVTMAPPLHFQFLTASGQPLALGNIYTYAAGTTTPLNTYIDSTGISQNTNPILLDATGSPSNGSNQTGIWLANNSYKFVAYNSQGVFQWSVDNVSGWLGLLNTVNTWTAQQTFTQPIIDISTDNQFITGTPGNQTTLDFPPPSSNITLHFPTTADTMVGRITTDTLNNKTLNTPALVTPTVNGIEMTNTPGAYVQLPNANAIGTSAFELVKMANAPSQAVVAATSDTGGVVGICVLNCGTTGNATIQQSGSEFCNFDGATVAGDYVQISSTQTGNCHDAGAVLPSSGQLIGRVQSTNGSQGSYSIILFGPEITPHGPVCATATPAVLNSTSSGNQSVASCQFPSGSLNAVGKSFQIVTTVRVTPNTNTSQDSFGFGTTSGFSSFSGLTSATSGSFGWEDRIQITCTVLTTGTSGTMWCSPLHQSASSSATLSETSGGFDSAFTINLTGNVFVGVGCNFGNTNASTCTSQPLIVSQLN